MDDELRALIREIGLVVLAERKMRLAELLIYTALGLGVGLWALLTLRYMCYRYLGV